MSAHEDAFLRAQQARWLRPDGDRWVRPDAARFLAPGGDLLQAFPALARKYNPNQPRVPAGHPDGGQWTDGGGSQVRLAQGPKNGLTDANGEPYYQRGGHHEMPRSVFSKWNLPNDTRRVFEDSTTGKLPSSLARAGPENRPRGHFWDDAHRQYNRAIRELSNEFLTERGIAPERMTPDDARELLRRIRISEDPRIREYNGFIRMLRRLFPTRSGE